MKRFILSLTAVAVLSMPMAASALEKMDNNQLKSSTGQAGVSIAVDDVVIYQESLADTTYWDADGLDVDAASFGNTSADQSVGAAGVMIDHPDKMKKLITIDAILDDEKYGVSALEDDFENVEFKESIGIAAAGSIDNPSNGNTAGMTSGISPLTIDVGTCQALTDGYAYNTGGAMGIPDGDGGLDYEGAVAGVVIGLPTVELTTYSNHDFKSIRVLTGDADVDDETGSVQSIETNSDNAMNAGGTMITIEKSGMSTMAILGGRVEIAPH